MDDNTRHFELILKNNNKGISYLIDVFQENTINSQEVIMGIIDEYRKKFDGIDSEVYSLIFRELSENEGNIEEKVVKIKDVSLFFIENGDISFENETSEYRKIKIINTINFKL